MRVRILMVRSGTPEQVELSETVANGVDNKKRVFERCSASPGEP
jgi:hypothetical protein